MILTKFTYSVSVTTGMYLPKEKMEGVSTKKRAKLAIGVSNTEI